jgi:hypothetical protein
MTEQTLRRSNWTANDHPPRRSYDDRPMARADEDPLAELARIVSRGDPFAEPGTSKSDPIPFRREPTFAPASEGHEHRLPFPSPSSGAPRAREPGGQRQIEDLAFEAVLRGTIDPDPKAPDHRATATAVANPAPADAVALGLDEAFLRDLDRELFGNDPPQAASGHAQDDVQASAQEGAPAWSDAAGATEPPEAPAQDEPTKPSLFGPGSGLATVAAVIGLVVVGAGGAVLYTMATGGARPTPVEPIVVRADDRPNRITPEPSADAQAQNKLIYDRLGTNANTPSNERVVSREEQPVTSLPGAAPSNMRVILPGGPVQATPQGSEPRRVATTTIRVRPDGTLESEPTRPASPAAAAAPASTPAPEQSSAGTSALSPVPPPQAATPPVPVARPPATASASIPPAPAAPRPPVAPVQRETPRAATLSAAPAAQRPAGAQTTGSTQLASVQSRPANEPRATAARSGGTAYVQVSSQRSAELARAAYSDLQRRFPALLGGRAPDIRAVDLGERGTFYRARVGGFATREEAVQFCTRLRNAGGDCIVAAN